jgi:hypothetical protein
LIVARAVQTQRTLARDGKRLLAGNRLELGHVGEFKRMRLQALWRVKDHAATLLE